MHIQNPSTAALKIGKELQAEFEALLPKTNGVSFITDALQYEKDDVLTYRWEGVDWDMSANDDIKAIMDFVIERGDKAEALSDAGDENFERIAFARVTESGFDEQYGANYPLGLYIADVKLIDEVGDDQEVVDEGLRLIAESLITTIVELVRNDGHDITNINAVSHATEYALDEAMEGVRDGIRYQVEKSLASVIEYQLRAKSAVTPHN